MPTRPTKTRKTTTHTDLQQADTEIETIIELIEDLREETAARHTEVLGKIRDLSLKLDELLKHYELGDPTLVSHAERIGLKLVADICEGVDKKVSREWFFKEYPAATDKQFNQGYATSQAITRESCGKTGVIHQEAPRRTEAKKRGK